MTPPIPFLDILLEAGFWWGVLKLLYLILFGLYALFSLVVLVQIKQMVKAVTSEFNGMMNFIGWAHVIVAVGALLLAFVIL